MRLVRATMTDTEEQVKVQSSQGIISDEYAEIQKRLKLANKAYFSLLTVMRYKDICKKTKVMLYKTLIRTVLTYRSETWMLSKKSENVLSISERKILRRIYGPVKDNS
jgi:hypothetical protein